MKNFKFKWLLLSFILSIASLNQVWGQNFKAAPMESKMQSSQIMSAGAYSGTVYEPFSSTTPSEQSYSPAKAPGGPRREKINTDDDEEEGGEGWIDKPDYGGTDLSPIGEPWIMALFALAFAGVIAIRQYKRKTIKSMNMKNSTKYIAIIGLLLTLGVGNVWADFSGGTEVILDVSNSSWPESNPRYAIKVRKDQGYKWASMSPVTNGPSGTYTAIIPTGTWSELQFCRMKPGDAENKDGNVWTWSADINASSGGDDRICYAMSSGWTNSGIWRFISLSSHTIYFDTRNVPSWTTPYFRIGRDNYCSAYAMTKVAGTQYLWSCASQAWSNYECYNINNAAGNTGAYSIYQESAEGITLETNHIYQNITQDRYITPTDIGTDKEYVDYYNHTNQTSLPSYTISFSSPEHGSIVVEKYNGSSYETISSGATLLPTQIIRITTNPDEGYELNSFSAGSNVTLISGSEYYVIGDNTISASFRAKTYTVTLDKGNGTSAGNVTSVSATYDAVLGTSLTSSGNLPTISTNGYGFAGYFSGENGAGTQYYNADGSPTSNTWAIDEVSPTLYAYFKTAEMSLALASITIGTGEGDSATVSITPAVGSPAFNQVGTIMFCYDVKIKNGASMDPQPVGRQFTEGGVLKYRFASPRYSGNYTLNIKLRAGSDCIGAQIDSKDIDFIVSGDHTVTIRHKCGDVEIHEPTTVTVHPGEDADAAGFEDADVFGYHFSSWTIGGTSGVTKTAGASTDRTITISAIYDGTITATYSKRNLIYFKNTLNWPDVWVHFLGSKYWDITEGSGNMDRANRNKHMTRIGETDVWYYDLESPTTITPNGFEVFTDREFVGKTGYANFHGTSSSDPARVSFPTVYDNTDDDDTRYGFHAGTPMFVPISQTPYRTKVDGVDSQIADNYNRGYWREYEPVTGKTGYTLKVYDKCASDGRNQLQSKEMIDSSEGAIFEATVDLEAGKTYGIKFLRGSDWYYTNTDSWKGDKPVATVFPTDESSVACYQLAENYAAIQLNTTVAGNYTFKIYCSASEGKLKMSVKYPAAINDYRIVYHDDATWTPENGAHGAGWIHPSHVITKRDGGEDIVSFFVKADKINKPTYRFQYLSNLSPITWTNMGVSATTIPDSILNKGTGVYNFHLKQEGGTISVVKIEPYTGNYYIRTDNAGSTKWSDFRASDHLMTYSEYADKKNDFTHYYMKFVTTDVDDATSYTDGDPNIKNVKFCIANDYSMCISDTLKQSSNDATHSHVDAKGDLQADANIRFMWNIKTNALSRKYLSRGQSNGTYFLVMKGQSISMLMAPNGDPLTSANNRGVEDNSIQFKDNQDWIYEAEVKAKPTGRIKLYARYHSEDQYFYGDNDGSFADPHGVELIGGSADGAAEVIRAIYDFKTNRLMAAWVPSGDIDADKTIEADIMLVREGQGGGGQINLADNVTLTTSADKRIYGVMRFNRWDLNNLSRTSGHAALDPGDQKTAYERFNYFISFPFDVKVGEIFGFGRIGRHYRIYFYDGIGRAQEGFFAERKTNWKMIDDTDSILHAYQGYFLQLNSVRMATDKTDVWPQAEQSEVELYFPAMRAISSITIANETIPALAPDGPYKCNKDLSSLHGGNQDANRTNKDSYWRCIGTPSFANYDANFEEWTDFVYKVDDKAMPYLYEWETTTNKLVPVASSSFEFLSMHSYLIQNPNQIVWANVSKPTYSAIVARTRDTEEEQEWKLTLTSNNDELLDQAFVRMSDNEAVTANFDFGQDLIKEWNEDANIYTFAGSEQVAGNSMPFSNQTTIVPVGVKIAADGEYTFAMPDGTEGIGVVLIDNIAGTRTNLALTDYTINLAAGTYDERFVLEISPVKPIMTDIETVDVQEVIKGARKVMVDGVLYIVKDGKIYDARGNRVE